MPAEDNKHPSAVSLPVSCTLLVGQSLPVGACLYTVAASPLAIPSLGISASALVGCRPLSYGAPYTV
jgi:hypothetical protein